MLKVFIGATQLIFAVTVFLTPILSAGIAVQTFRPFDLLQFCSQIITDQCNTTFASIDEINKSVRPLISLLVQSNYFRYFKLNLDKECKFWNAQHFCATENCAVDVLEPPYYNWSNVAKKFQPAELGKINRTNLVNSLESSKTCEDFDYCYIDDDHHCVVVDLVSNPERFTGYGGVQSFAVWRAIYAENCFPNTTPMLMEDGALIDQCAVKNVFYRLVSGMHASISVHLSNDYLCADTGEFYPSLQTFMERVGAHNDRLSNIYFNYALVSEAIVKLNSIIPLYDFVASRRELVSVDGKDHSRKIQSEMSEFDDSVAGEKLVWDLLPAIASNTLLNTSALFPLEPSSLELKQEFRLRFKNISAIMDCVGCDRCRMWGKVQTIGYGTALKILFESNDADSAPSAIRFRRIEVVALINTFDRLSKSVEIINNFKNKYIDFTDKFGLVEGHPGGYETEMISEGLMFPFAGRLAFSLNSAPMLQKIPMSVQRNSPSKDPLTVVPRENPVRVESRWQNLKRQVALCIQEIKEALKFIFMSYVEFPSIIFHHVLTYVSEQWIRFIGKPTTEEWRSPLTS